MYRKFIIQTKAIVGTLLLVLLVSINVFGQGTPISSNLTDFLGVQPMGTETAKNIYFEEIGSGLNNVGSDCFLLTFDLPNMGPIDTSGVDVLSFLSGAFKFGILPGDEGWYVDRAVGSSASVRYVVFDDVQYEGKFTFVISAHYLGIAKDEGTGWRFAPLFFGLNSNLEGANAFVQYIGADADGYLVRHDVISSVCVSGYKDNGLGSVALDSRTIDQLILRLKSTEGQNSTVNARVATTEDTPEEKMADKEETAGHFMIYPNPSEGNFQVQFSLDSAQLVTYQLLDLQGRLIQQKQRQYDVGMVNWPIDLPNQTKQGVYILRVSTGEWSKSQQLVLK